jgi:hypothetical protein
VPVIESRSTERFSEEHGKQGAADRKRDAEYGRSRRNRAVRPQCHEANNHREPECKPSQRRIGAVIPAPPHRRRLIHPRALHEAGEDNGVPQDWLSNSLRVEDRMKLALTLVDGLRACPDSG